MITRGFPNLPIIRRAITRLWRSLSPEGVRRFVSGYHATRDERPSGNSIIATQHIARRIAALYQLRIGSVVVTFVSHLDRPGRIELSDSDDFFIELQSDYRRRYEQVAAILAHEIAHIFCHRLKISIGNTFEDEVLTDTAAAYLGAGVPILNAFTEESDYTADTPNRMRQQCFGYITPDEFGYVLAKRHAAFGENPLSSLATKSGTEAYQYGRARAQQDLLCPPLRSAPISARAAYRFRRHFASRSENPDIGPASSSSSYYFERANGHAVIFHCPTCFQRLRLPTRHNNISVKCPLCCGQFICAT